MKTKTDTRKIVRRKPAAIRKTERVMVRLTRTERRTLGTLCNRTGWSTREILSLLVIGLTEPEIVELIERGQVGMSGDEYAKRQQPLAKSQRQKWMRACLRP
jgi:hypothetical protein